MTILDSGISGSYAVGSFANDNTVIISGSTLVGSVCGLYHNGSYYGFECYVSDTTIVGGDSDAGTLADDDADGVYISGSTTTEAAAGCHTAIFTDCTISGATGIEVKYTNLTLSNCTVTATGTTPTFEQYNNGSTTSGFAVVSTDNTLSGTDPQPSGTITINSGTYTGLVGLTELIDLEQYPDFKEATYVISGGNFTTQIPASYCAEGYVLTTTKNAEGYYTVERITYTLSVTAPTYTAVTYGYTQPTAAGITITSTGNSNATITGVSISGTDVASFTLNKTDGTTIAASMTDSTTYTIQPKDGLSVGTYTATITVTYNNSATATAEVSFTVNKADQSVSYSESTMTKHINDAAFTNTLTQAIGDGTMSYTSSDTAVATVNGNGEVTIVGAGSTTITATAASTGNYNEATASYPLTVTAHSYSEPSFTWSEDGKSCTVSFTCTDCNDVQTVTATVISKVKTAATATENGVTIYTATVTFDSVDYTATKELADISATGSTGSDDSDETESTDTESFTDSETTTAEDVAVATISAETGDNSEVELWLLLLLVSGVGIAGIAIYNTKRRRSR